MPQGTAARAALDFAEREAREHAELKELLAALQEARTEATALGLVKKLLR
jgi:hypothetical protein